MPPDNGSGSPIDLSTHESRVGSLVRAQRSLAADVLEKMADRARAPEVSTTTGKHQRAQTRVPTSERSDGTVVSIGRRAEGRGYDGYGLTTIAHVAVSAGGGKQASTLTMQANGQTLVQSDDDSVFVVSKGPAVLASAAVSNIVASGGVAISAGGSVEVENAAIEGERPSSPKALAKHADLAREIIDSWSGWSTSARDVVTARDDRQRDLDPDFATEQRPTQNGIDEKDLAEQTLDKRNALGTAKASSGGALAMYGDGGVLVGTPKWAAVHAQEALTLSSDAPAIVAHKSFDLTAALDVRWTSGRNATLHAQQRVRIVAGDGDVQVATRSGSKLEVLAKAVHIGELAPASPQAATELVSARATKRISFATDKDGARSEGPDGVFLRTHETFDSEADKTIRLAIADQQIDIVVDQEGIITIRAGTSELEVSKRGGLSFKRGAALIGATSDRVFAGTDAGNKMEIRSSGLEIKGSQIKIG